MFNYLNIIKWINQLHNNYVITEELLSCPVCAFTFIVRSPEIIQSPENITILPKTTADFYCLASSQNGLIYDWEVLDRSLPYSAIISCDEWQFSTVGRHFTTGNHLTIPNVQPSDEGWYCCLATNERGTVKECAWLEVNSKWLPTGIMYLMLKHLWYKCVTK